MSKAALICPLLLGCGAIPPGSGPAAQPAHAHAPAHSQPGHQHGHDHRFTDAARWAERFESPERAAWQKPDAVVAWLELAPDATVADVGSGTGYFAVRLARAVPRGTVYGADLEPEMVAWLAKRAEEDGLPNLRSIAAKPSDPSLPEPVDLIFVCNTWHHVHDRIGWLAAARAQLRPGGRIVIVDYQPDAPGGGPPKAMRLAPDTVVAEMALAGFAVQARDESLLPRQYLLAFGPAKAP